MRKLTEPGIAARLKSDRAVSLARAQRKQMTRAEKVLWQQLRQFPVGGSHWRKQAPIGPFIADFACHAAKLIVEVDGSIHDARQFAARDAERQEWLEGRGYRVLRFRNEEVLSHVAAVVRRIISAVEPGSSGKSVNRRADD